MPSHTPLPDFLLVDWFKKDLVIIDAPASAQKKQEPAVVIKKNKEWKVLGDHKKKITVLVNEPDVAFLPEEEFNLLSGILKACHLSMVDVALINLAQTEVTYPELKERSQPQFLLMFQVSTSDIELPFSIPYYQLQQYDNCQLLQAASLRSMLGESMAAKEEKNKLWQLLKKMFSSFMSNKND